MKIRIYYLLISLCSFSIYAEEYEFSPAMLSAGGLSDISALSGEDTFYNPGEYDVSVYINNKLFSKKSLTFERKGKSLTPLFTGEFINSLPLKRSQKPWLMTENTRLKLFCRR